MLSNDQFLNKGRYRVVNTFGQTDAGGMYEAYDTVNNTNVVLKETVGSPGKVTTSSQMEAINSAFLGGAKTLTEIRHESLVSVQDYFADIDRQYLVLEPVTGFDLTKFLKPGEPKPILADVLSWADQLLDALQFLHTRQTPIIHGDIRPENVKLTSDSTVKLLTAHAHTDDVSDIITLAPTQSSDDSGVHYRPLEQLWDGLDALSQRVILNHYDEASERWLLQPLSAATDLYSLGATLYSVLSGTIPPDALDRSIAALEGKPDPLRDPAEFDAAIPPEISDVIMKAMSLRREDRFYSAVILRQILRTAAVRAKERLASEPGAEITDVKASPESRLETPPQILARAETQMEQDRLSSEERRLEIEAEQERLEHKRLNLEKRRLELEAEMECQKAEQARQQIEHERLTAEAEVERELIENERKAREAEQAREIEAKNLAERSDDADTPFLELEPFVTPANPDNDFSELLEVPETPVVHSFVTDQSAADNDQDVDFVLAGSDRAQFNFRLPLIAVAVVLLAAAVIGVWKFTSADMPSASTSAAAQPLNVPTQTEVQTPPTDEQNLAEPTRSAVVDPSTETPTAETVTHDRGTKTVQLNTAPEKQKKLSAPARAKTAAPKKAVTVDDLINDH